MRPALTAFPVCAESYGLRDRNADAGARTGFCHPTAGYDAISRATTTIAASALSGPNTLAITLGMR